MKRKIVKVLFSLIKFITWKEPCIIYRRLFIESPKQEELTYCPFCELDKQQIYNTRERLYHWQIIYNKYPYPKTKLHLLLIPKRHIKKWNELSYNELQELQTLISHALNKWFILLWRHYPNAWSSIEHLHIHLIK